MLPPTPRKSGGKLFDKPRPTEKQISGYEALLAQTAYELEENRKQEEIQYATFCERARVMEEAGAVDLILGYRLGHRD